MLYKLSKDHKPDDDYEKQRIETNGGSVYRSQIVAKPPFNQYYDYNPIWTRIGLFPSKPPKFPEDCEYVLVGPHRVNPGRLSVSRTFGDVTAKLEKYGGKDGIIICEPDIKEFDISESLDYIMLGCDGIFDKLTNTDVHNTVMNTIHNTAGSLHQLTGYCVESVLRTSAAKRTLDNITVVMVVFKSLKKTSNRLMKIKHGKKHDDLEGIIDIHNIDVTKMDIDEDYMKEVLSWRRKDENMRESETGSQRRDASVPISRRSNYERFRYHEQNRNNSNIRGNGMNYQKFKQNSRLIDLSTQYGSDEHPNNEQNNSISIFNFKKPSDDGKSLTSINQRKLKGRMDSKSLVSPAQSPFPIKTKKMQLFPKEL